jgi:hypothetical protein
MAVIGRGSAVATGRTGGDGSGLQRNTVALERGLDQVRMRGCVEAGTPGRIDFAAQHGGARSGP